MASSKTTGLTKPLTRSSSRVQTENTPSKLQAGPNPELEVAAETTASQDLSTVLKKRELMQLVAARAELPNNKVKPVMEAMLAVLGEAIGEGRELNLQPFGRVKINRQKVEGNVRVTVAKLRQTNLSNGDEQV